MRIETKRVREGYNIGFYVWICHYLRPDIDKKPLRNIPPTRCLVKSVSELPANKKVYYSKTFFSPVNKNGSISTKIISPVDNTGFRSYCGNELFIFDNEQECVKEWNTQLEECENRIKEKMAMVLDELKADISNIIKMKR